MAQSLDNLSQIVREACKYPPESKERQKQLTKLIRIINPKLWRDSNAYYEDALQETWVYFCQNICEGNTGKTYDPDRANVVTWLNNYLKWRLKDAAIAKIKQQKQTVAVRINENNETNDPIANLTAKTPTPPIIEEIEQWIRQDTDGKLSQTHIEKHPQVTCQVLLLKRLPPETSWKDLSAEYGISVGTLSSFYQRKCKPLLRKFSQSQGYI